MRDAHESRYVWVTEHVDLTGTRVLDLGCGTGYGTQWLVEHADAVVGVDVSTAAIAHARTQYPATNATYVAVAPDDDLGHLGTFDLALSYEVIEHVANPFDHVATIAGLLACDGMAVVATPNRWHAYRSEPGRLRDPSHVMEFTPEALASLLSLWFADVRLWFQVWPPAAVPPTPVAAPTPFVPRLRRATRAFAWSLLSEGQQARRRAAAPQVSTAIPGMLGRTLADYESRYVDAPEPGAFGLLAVCRGPVFPSTRRVRRSGVTAGTFAVTAGTFAGVSRPPGPPCAVKRWSPLVGVGAR